MSKIKFTVEVDVTDELKQKIADALTAKTGEVIVENFVDVADEKDNVAKEGAVAVAEPAKEQAVDPDHPLTVRESLSLKKRI